MRSSPVTKTGGMATVVFAVLLVENGFADQDVEIMIDTMRLAILRRAELLGTTRFGVDAETKQLFLERAESLVEKFNIVVGVAVPGVRELGPRDGSPESTLAILEHEAPPEVVPMLSS